MLRARGETTESFPDAPRAPSSWPAKAGYLRLCCEHKEKTWMPTYVGMTMWKRPLRHVEHLFPGKSSVRRGARRKIGPQRFAGANCVALPAHGKGHRLA